MVKLILMQVTHLNKTIILFIFLPVVRWKDTHTVSVGDTLTWWACTLV